MKSTSPQKIITNNEKQSYNDLTKKNKRKATIVDQWINQIVCRHYKIIEYIDQGSFGYCFKGIRINQSSLSNSALKSPSLQAIDQQSQQQQHQLSVLSTQQQHQEFFAIKIEDNHQKNNDTLTREAKILFDLKAEKGFPRLYYYIKNDRINTMVQTMLDKNLDKLHKMCNKKFSLKTTLMIADQILTRLQYLHSKSYIHRDIKPDNFMIGCEQEQRSTIYLIDFGLSKSYLKKDGVSHIDFSEKVGLVGTTRYTSVYSHLGMEQSRRDDLESLGYTLIYFMKGDLPWMNLPGATKEEKQNNIARVKMRSTTQILCAGLETEFHSYMNYVKGLGFYEEPNYNYLKKLFRTLFLKKKYQYDDKFDWIQDSQPANDRRNMFKKFESFNPISKKQDIEEEDEEDESGENKNNKEKDSHSKVSSKDKSNKNNQNNNNDGNGLRDSTQSNPYKRKGTRKSSVEFKRPINLEVRIIEVQEDDKEKEVSKLSSKNVYLNERVDLVTNFSDFDNSKQNNSTTAISIKNLKVNQDKQQERSPSADSERKSSNELNSNSKIKEEDEEEDLINDEYQHSMMKVSNMIKKLQGYEIKIKRYKDRRSKTPTVQKKKSEPETGDRKGTEKKSNNSNSIVNNKLLHQQINNKQ